MELKRCRSCQQQKPSDDFYLRADSGKYRSDCKDCCCKNATTPERLAANRIRLEQQRIADPDRFKLYSHTYYKRNKAQVKAARHVYYQNNAERIREDKRNRNTTDAGRDYLKRRDARRRLTGYYQTPERRAKASRRSIKHRHANPEKVRVYNAARRARELNAPVIEPINRYEIFERDGFKCHLCERGFPVESLTLDHVIPLSRGGTHTADNMKTACSSCNCRKNDRLLSELDLSTFRAV